MGDTVDYKQTILLPQTDFPMRANLAQREPQMLERWATERVYERALQARAGARRYVFHDGPPYANGHIHYGHILNKTLKDIVVKYQLVAGRLTRFVPGWDCHGLPIELNVERALGPKRATMTPLQLRAACRKEAEKWVAVQRKELVRLGAFATWDTPYLTLDPGFERGILEALAAFVRHDLLYRGKKPVHWCGHCRTALAEAEVEYQDHVSPSIYVKFPVPATEAAALADKLGLDAKQRTLPIHALIWTTTPWTLPANLAIAVHPEHAYVALDVGGELWLVASALASRVLAATGRQEHGRSRNELPGAALAGVQARHPFEDRASPLLVADHVTLEAGTGLVHTAPGHGADDYRLGQEHGLDTFAPVDEAARFTDEVRPEWRGLHVLEANPLIVHFLHERSMLANREGESLRHSYPCCWRCKNPVIFRATIQWFIALDKPLAGRSDGSTLRALALSEIEAIAGKRDLGDEGLESGFIPAWGRDRIHGMLADRPDWCISRQRVWGVPIPALHCRACQHALLDVALVEHVAEIVGREGTDAWYRREAKELAPVGLRCPSCGGSDFDKDQSILDVWFESGASFWATMRDEQAGFGLPVDLYLEGSDQHRGWFHSSLLVGCAMIGRAPYKRVLTHGFVCDENGRPYSKSDLRRRQEAGEKVEYIEPETVIKQQGAELLRLWVAYEDFRSDVRYSRDHIKQVSDAYFKIRNTLRFLLGNLHGYTPGAEPAQIDPLDRWARARLRRYCREVVQAYERYDFRTVYHRTVELCAGEWSSFYLDVVKDRLYCDAADGARRRSCQATLDSIARSTITALAPLTSFTADEAWRHLPGEAEGSVFLAAHLTAPEPEPDDAELLAAADALFAVRDAVNLALEPKIKAKEIGHRREVAVRIALPKGVAARLGLVASDLADALTVASVETEEGEAMQATVTRTTAAQCQRCWRHRDEVGRDPAHPDLCARCAFVLSGTRP
ncbi:MAG: isoleucine--tRNA ligase [Polyangiales bacterium]